ncbi:hypothetical protein ACH4TP_37980 [Streptomyces sp. NPDC021012]|uniref:hypothetical protein n=1 Tax=Streptomyces sp. NPDC021012 TaxID=3365107 RepID=UPI0037A2BE98
MSSTTDTITDVINLLAGDDTLYDRFMTAIENLANPTDQHDGHAPEALTVERLAEDIASAI